jgi:hypothetical protein
MEDKIMKVMGEMYDPSKAEMMARICDCMGVTPEEWAQIRQMVRRVEAVEGRCTSVVHSCATQENLLKMACCPANMMYSQITVDKFSHQNQVPVLTPVTGLGGDYVDSLPLPPGKKIRFRQERRPGYSPKHVTVAQNLANDGKNFLDIAVTFHVSSDPPRSGRQDRLRVPGLSVLQQRGHSDAAAVPDLSQPARHGRHAGVPDH